MSEQKVNKFKDTLNLPTTEFSLRANAAVTEPAIRARWTADGLDRKAHELHKGGKKFVLHDGPPYSNGHIHMGTAFNKTLKDIVNKSRRMTGLYVPFKPGWDCHGLPIELKVGGGKDTATATTAEKLALKKACREFAAGWIETQQKEFMQLGVLADWGNKYATMYPGYEADIVRAFAVFVEKGYIERKGKTVPWCASCKTVLAHAEIEHKDRKDPSLYTLFPLTQAAAKSAFRSVLAKQPNLQISVVIWTTTPWTIPLNRAVILHPTASYVLVKGRVADEAFMVGKDLAAKVCEKVGLPLDILAETEPSTLQGHMAVHPFLSDREVPFILDNSVLLTDGTAAVHSAPGCGPEDYVIGIKNGLEIFSPLSADGKYTKGIEPVELEGMAIADGQGWVIRKLMELGRLLHKESISHAYPHCWRCKNGLMFRATDQWFCSLEKDQFVQKTLKEIEKIAFIPDWGQNRLAGSVGTRTEWCLSRQRQWGVPIIALFCKACKHPYADTTFIRVVADQIAKKGIEYWDEVTVEQMVATGVLKSLKCTECSNTQPDQFRKETDILDVWFESGVSHYAVLAQDAELGVPCDMYLEGSDQHRAWFQSSLLTAMVLNGHTPMHNIMTHGYVVDAKGYKMSKSLGNVTAPDEVIKKYSVDILRLWVAATDFEKDIVISDALLTNIAEVYRKLRNTCRFALSNLYDYDHAKNQVPLAKLRVLDAYALVKLAEFEKKVKECYANYHFTMIYQLLATYTANELSAFYFDIIKDRLYTEKADGYDRRSAQTVLYHILDSLTRLMAPILSFLAEEVADYQFGVGHTSVHLTTFGEVEKTLKGTKIDAKWSALERLRDIVLKAIEPHRAAGEIKHSLEARVTIHLAALGEDGKAIADFISQLEKKEDITRFFKDWFIVSQVEFAKTGEAVSVERAHGTKCPRCWQWEETSHEDGLCKRCEGVVTK